ncbi:MAG: oligoribonuclease [Oceanospirillaceae bacterium]|uniref:oligoribonuclease n=1 Tax=unclassified Thalassolituus TaxID=2624967 RepID=UPI000C0B6A57|nr:MULTISPECIES: oligoribonuclease [unclassified Thalassolituus]MAK92004.1 oligoribonuclease [Thalassolituus sp.]MAS26479.1 oligoribonuclease [Oceanospirillaceae bacterium]MAX98034.1 oligoribonuclease [Oceanospirillaceae bacterium]MBS52700.1 oligoribonuclease [Oceanospirillaceae bacterium]|tara:strand:- start:4200 stop:4742 length:543 start_codon:yes stop_codon:yes gene_type:complete
MSQNDNLVWMDLEMTGLDPEHDVIIEIATIVTDGDLNIIAEGPVIAVSQPDVLLDAMDEWNTKTHGNSGLTQRVRDSDVDAREAQRQTIEFLQQYVKAGASPLCGNSIHQDRRFLVKYMPELEAYMHYRNIDVSTLKELAKRWKPEVVSSFEKKGSHQALDDIRESIAEMLHYRKYFLDV